MSDASLEAIAACFGGEMRGSRAHFRYAGLSMRALLDVSSGVPDGLLVVVALGPLPRILLRREVASDRTAKRWRLAREVQLGDAAFDDAVYVDARVEDAVARHLLARPEARAAVRQLLEVAYEVRLDEEGVTLQLPGPEQIDLERVARAVEAATLLARALPPDAARWISPTSGLARSIFVGVIAAGVTASVVTFAVGLVAAGSSPPIDTFTMLGLGLAISLALWLALALVVLLAIRGRSDAHRLLPIAIVVPALLTFPLGPTGLVLANAMLDASPEIEHVLEPLESHVGESDGDPYVWVRFRSFRDPTESLDLRFEGDHVPNAHARVHLFTHEGALGFPWIVHATLVD